MSQNGSQEIQGSIAGDTLRVPRHQPQRLDPYTGTELITALAQLLKVEEKEVEAAYPPGPGRNRILATKIRSLILESASKMDTEE